MDEQKYLIAIALCEQNNKRLMPLGGKTVTRFDISNQVHKKESEKILLDLLLRLFQRTSEGNLKMANDKNGILLAEISFENMQKNIPLLKSNWINTGSTDILIKELKTTCSNLWSIQYKKHEGIIFNDLRTN